MAQLFELRSDHSEGAPEIPAGATANIGKCIAKKCSPRGLTLERASERYFSLLEVVAGPERLEKTGKGCRVELDTKRGRKAVLEAGENFWLTVCNDSDKPRHFRCKVWGLPSP